MTEPEWLSSNNPASMLVFLTGAWPGTVSAWEWYKPLVRYPNQKLASVDAASYERKLRLFVAACARDLLVNRPDLAGVNAKERKAFGAAIGRVEAFAEGQGHLSNSSLWIELPSALDSAFEVVGIDTDVGGLQRRPVEEAIKDFQVNPAHWLREMFGPLPFRAVQVPSMWRTSDVVAIAIGIYEERVFDRMAILADALQDAGCDSDDLLNHLRDPNATHVRGCWALDLVLGKA